jgi:phage gpG-like protein
MDNADQLFDTLNANFKKAMAKLPKVVGNEVVNFSKESFNRQAWLGDSVEPWRKRRYKKKDSGRAILVKTGRLRRSIRVVSSNLDTVVVGTDVPYAKAHNEGYNGTVSVKAHQRNKYSKSKVGSGSFTKSGKERMKTVTSISGSGMVKAHTKRMKLPKRQFLGNSQYLVARLKRVAILHISKSF